ncbi:MAG: hypothetical protein EA376_00745 [Phycisphaeraceae bacterium]|nr:MAG: hypothetical protein EA376_00745 [Phycisphaeraceae bacterium]
MSNEQQPQQNPSEAGASASDASRSNNGEQAMDLIASMEAQIASIKKARSEQEQASAELLERERQLSEREGEFKNREESTAKLEQELRDRRSELEASMQALEQREADLTQRLDQLEQERRELTTRAEEQEQELRRKEAEIEETSRSLDAAIAHATERAAELAREREHFEHERSKTEARVAERQKALDATRAELEQARAELKSQREGAGGDAARLTELETRCAELEQQLEAAKAESEANADALAEAERDRDALDAKVAELSARIEQHAAGADTAGEESTARIDALQRELTEASAERDALAMKKTELEKEIARLQQSVSEAGASGGEDDAKLKKLAGEVAKRDRAIEVLSERLKTAQTECETLRKSGGAGAAKSGASSQWAKLRRQRLQRYKDLLRSQSAKIVSAKATLAKRQEEYERLLQKRQELAQAKAALDAANERVQKSAARNKASVSLLSLVFAIGILGALSWSIAERAVPGTFLVEATVEARHEGTPLSPEQLAAWNDFIEGLAKEPTLMEMAADRMKRRGIAELASPAAVAARMRSDLDVNSPAPGRTTLTLRGEGADRTRRVLDTFMAAMITVANDGRVRRIDNATTAMSGSVSPDPAPIDQPHIIVAAIAWAATSGAALLIFFVLWMRLSSSKRRFDESDPALSALDPGGWPQGPGARPNI